MTKDAEITFRLTQEQKDEIKNRAAARGIKTSDFFILKMFDDDLNVDSSLNIDELKSLFIDVQNGINEIAQECRGSEFYRENLCGEGRLCEYLL